MSRRHSIRNMGGTIMSSVLISIGSIETNNTFDPSSGDWSLYFWSKGVGTTQWAAMYSQKDGTGTGQTWFNVNSLARLATIISGSANTMEIRVPFAGDWHLYTMTYDSSATEIKYYKDAVLIFTGTITPTSADGNHIIGADKNGTASNDVYYTEYRFFENEVHSLSLIEDYYYDNVFDRTNLTQELLFTEGSGSTLANTGSTGGSATISGTGFTWSDNQPYRERSVISTARSTISTARSTISTPRTSI